MASTGVGFSSLLQSMLESSCAGLSCGPCMGVITVSSSNLVPGTPAAWVSDSEVMTTKLLMMGSQVAGGRLLWVGTWPQPLSERASRSLSGSGPQAAHQANYSTLHMEGDLGSCRRACKPEVWPAASVLGASMISPCMCSYTHGLHS